MKFILGVKENMSQIWDKDGNAVVVTVLKAEPMTVTAIKDGGKDGYKAVQFGVGVQKESRISKPVLGQTKDLGFFKFLKEFRIWNNEEAVDLKRGDKVDVSIFKEGDDITVAGVSKAKGFQGVVKRHGFAGGSRTHGQKHSEREPGSIGGGARAGGRVAKGLRMAGRMGGDRVTLKNLSVAQVNVAENTIAIKGAVPGRRGTVIEIIGQ